MDKEDLRNRIKDMPVERQVDLLPNLVAFSQVEGDLNDPAYQVACDARVEELRKALVPVEEMVFTEEDIAAVKAAIKRAKEDSDAYAEASRVPWWKMHEPLTPPNRRW